MSTAAHLPEYPFYADIEGPVAIVHRGGDAAGAKKENSLAAFESAWRAGIVYAETDTVATVDGVALAFHGSYSEKHEQRTGLPLRSLLETMTHDEVKNEIRIGGEEVPTLEELLTTLPGMRFFIDPKMATSVAPLAKVINTLRVYDRVAVGAMEHKRTKAVAELTNKKICTSMGALGALSILGSGIHFPGAASYLRGLGDTQLALPHKLSHTQVPASDEGWRSNVTLTTSGMIERAHEAGLRVFLWTPDTESAIDAALDTGADGVMSDRTELVLAAANARK